MKFTTDTRAPKVQKIQFSVLSCVVVYLPTTLND